MIVVSDGVTFENVRSALACIYFGITIDSTPEEYARAREYVVPMQHNFENPIRPGSDDTFIEYWIDDDDRLTQDWMKSGWKENADGEAVPVRTNSCEKLARVTLRFLGVQAESWAKMIHHLTKRDIVAMMFHEWCNASALEYIGPIRPTNVDYFGVQNTTIGFDIVMQLQYTEVIELTAQHIEFLSLAEGTLALEVEGGSE